MRGDFKSVTGISSRPLLFVAALGLTLAFSASAQAARTGHGRVVSEPGQPLQIVIPLMDLSTQDLSVLQVRIADARLWSQVGLTPPAPVETLRVVVQPGTGKDARELLVSSSQSVNQPVIDLLLDVATATGSSQMQVSFVVPTRTDAGAAGALSGSASGSLAVKPGETLFAIAQRNAVPGTTVYQMLWALYQANPEAFIADNMNLLRAGARLNVPDAETVRAVDPKMAQQMFLQHQQAYNQRRGGVAGARGGAAPVLKPGTTQSGTVSAAPVGKQPGAQGDQLRLTTASAAEQRADAKVAAAKELAEVQARVDALQKNVQQLKEILAQPDDPATGTSKAATAATGATGTAGSAGSTDATGPGTAADASTRAAGATIAGGSASEAVKTAPADQSKPRTLDKISAFLADNILVVLTGVLAVCAFIIALVLRRAGARRDDEVEDTDASAEVPASPGAVNFGKTLESIDLNLDSDVAPGEGKGPLGSVSGVLARPGKATAPATPR